MSFQPMEMTETQAKETLGRQDEQGVVPMPFTKIDSYTTFRAEYAIDANDLVFHFFLPPELEHQPTVENPKPSPILAARIEKYWKDSFPRSLDIIARDFFKAESPRLRAAYVNEYGINSWWLRGSGMADVLDPNARVMAFLDRLDQALDAVKVSHFGV